MSYFRKLDDRLQKLFALLRKDERWLILINADPDALASAMALKRIMGRRVKSVAIGQINVITRPDNLAMIKTLRIPSRHVTRLETHGYDRYALVDSQPGHNPDFRGLQYSIILDHHPVPKNEPPVADYVEVRTDYGANATLLTEYLYNLKIIPGRLLATALLYGIKTDTQDFERDFSDTDVRAFRYLNKFADHGLLKKIVRSEYHLSWLKHFSLAFRRLLLLPGGIAACMGKVDNPDLLVILADFFLRVQEISWTAVAGIYKGTLVVIFRGDGLRRHMGEVAKEMFEDVGSAGGHRAAARAEIPLSALAGQDPETFLLARLDPKNLRKPLSKFPHAKNC